MVQGQICQHLSVQNNVAFIQLVNKSGVIDTVRSYGCIDPGDPKSSESAFFLSSVDEGIFHCPLYSILSDCVNF